MSDKSTRWCFTAYEGQWSLFETKPDIVKWWIWQVEACPTSGKHHYQGVLLTTRQVREKQMRDTLPGVHVEIARDWHKSLQYVKKPDTRVEGANHHNEDIPRQTIAMDTALIRVAQYRDRTVKYDIENVERWKQMYEREYDEAVAEILTEDSSLVGLYAQPIFRVAYVKWRKVWVSRADAEEIDRQTDRQPGVDT